MKRLALTLLLLMTLAGLLLAGAYFYEQRWGLGGPFPAHRHHH